MKKIVVLIASLFIFTNNIFGITYKGCESSYVAKLKGFVSNINITYDYYMDESPIFSVTLNNITPDMYFIDVNKDRTYYYSDTNNGEIVISGYSSGEKGKYNFYSINCDNAKLGSKYYSFPMYNSYYNDPLCDGLNINVCDKWVSVNYTRNEFERIINEYKSPSNNESRQDVENNKTALDEIVEFYVKYYIPILSSVIIICLIIIFLKRRKDKFNLKV